MEQVTGIEPASSAWKADILAIVLHLHIGAPDGTRTRGLPLKRRLLYQLSYWRIWLIPAIYLRKIILRSLYLQLIDDKL